MALSLADGVEVRSRARAVSAQREAAVARAAERTPSRFSLDETEAQAFREPAKATTRTSDRASERMPARPAGDGHGPAKHAASQDRPAASDRPERDARTSEQPEPAADRPAESQQGSTDPAEPTPTRAGETEAARRPRPAADLDANAATRGPSSADGKLAKAEPARTEAACEAAEIPADNTDAGIDAETAASEATGATGTAAQPPADAWLTPPALVMPATLAAASPVAAGRTTPSAENGTDAVAADETAAAAGTARADAAPGKAVQVPRGKAGAAFEAALSAATAESGKDAAAPGPTAADAASATIAAPAATLADAKAAATVQAATPTPATQAPPVSAPLGGVPMTIGLRALGGSSRFEIRLDPVELGHIEVAVEIDRERGTVGARLVVERPETLALLQRDASSLQQALAQTGLDASAGITLSLRGDGTGERQGSETGTGAQGRGPGRDTGAGTTQTVEASALDRQPLHAWRGLSGIDIRI